MSSSSSVKEFVLITRDEYSSLLATKQHIQNNVLTASPHNQCTSLVQQQQSSPTHLTPSQNGSILDFDLKTNENIAAGTSAAVAQLNLQTRFEANKKGQNRKTRHHFPSRLPMNIMAVLIGVATIQQT